MLRRILRLLVLLLAVPVPAAEPGPSAAAGIRPAGEPGLRFRVGDDPRWADPAFDDSDWQPISGRELPARSGIYWVRWRLRARPVPPLRPPDGLLLKVVASYDLYWDGRLIGRSGRVSADADDESPGFVDTLFQLPPDLLGPGEHIVALRMSSWHTGFPGPTYGLNLARGNFRAMLVERSRTALFSVMAVGAALVAAVVFGLMWLLAGRRRSLLVCSVLFAVVALLQALQAWRWLYEYPYDWHYPRLVVITALATALAVLLPVFLLEHFEIRRRRAWALVPLAGALVLAWFSTPFYNGISLFACAAGFAVALGVAIAAVVRRRRGARVAAAGLAASLVALIAAPRDFLDYAFFLSAGPALLGLLVMVVLDLREERRAARRMQLTAARLETELLKKNIQPHFLLNTLATIQEVIEQEPRTAVTLIDALAAEFRILSRVAGQTLIPLGEELELCRAHLRVMSLRKGAVCELVARGVDEAAPIPPALFHTLVENGLTHLAPRGGRIEFDLRADRLAGGVRYTLTARGERQAAAAEPREGTGLRYVRARLEESFTGAWSLAGVPVPEGWETMIELRTPVAVAPLRAAAAPAWPQPQPVSP